MLRDALAHLPSLARLALPADLPRLPSLCAVCHGWGARRVCAECLSRFAPRVPRCRRCAIDVPEGVMHCGACLRQPPPHAGAVAAVGYHAPWDTLIARFKFHAGLDLTHVLALRLAEAVREYAAPMPDLLVPAPLSTERLRERGYNQAWELTRCVARVLDHPTDARLLLRIAHRPPQLALPPAQRERNVRGAFAVARDRRAAVQGRHLALVDDVVTTGATAAEASRTLLGAGAASVQVWTLARTPRPADR